MTGESNTPREPDIRAYMHEGYVRAYDVRGWFYYWATPGGIEEIAEPNTGTRSDEA